MLNHDGAHVLTSRKAVHPDLENLFAEKEINWKRCDFVRACLEANIKLDDNPDKNKTKLFTWFDSKKHKTKQAGELL
jgi:hypothetical protein